MKERFVNFNKLWFRRAWLIYSLIFLCVSTVTFTDANESRDSVRRGDVDGSHSQSVDDANAFRKSDSIANSSNDVRRNRDEIQNKLNRRDNIFDKVPPLKSVQPVWEPHSKEGKKGAHTHDVLDSQSIVDVDLGFVHAFVASLSVIIVSEIGDKTFFIAAIMAMRHSRMLVFAGAIAALALMTVLSALLGYATTIIPRWFTYYASSLLFAIFGLKMLREAYLMDAEEAHEEYEEVQSELRKKDEEYEKQNVIDIETGITRTPQRRFLYSIFSRIFLQAFMMTFLAEWGDRSQISTIILAARDEVIGVIIGGTLGHALCTGLAVIGGRFIAQRISLKTVHIIGGIVFLIFATSALLIEPDDHN